MKGLNERYLFEILNDAYPGQWVNEYKGIVGRKFRFDAANPALKIAVEIEGALWTYGRHNRPVGMLQDMKKYNIATVEGWRVLRYDSETLRKRPWELMSDIRKLCGVSEDLTQKQLDFTGCKQTKIEQVQVKLS